MRSIRATILMWVVLLLALFSTKVYGADMQVAEYNGQTSITIEGEFAQGDSVDFRQLYTMTDGVTQVVLFDSPGGQVEEYSIARLVHEEGLDVVVAEGVVCTSYCGFIALADSDYTMEPDSMIKLHSVYIPPHYIVDLWNEGYCMDETIDGVETETCGHKFEQEGVVVGIETMTRDSLREMIEFMNEIGSDMDLILKVMEYGPTEFYQITAE